ncbi:Ferredoxin [Methanosarcina lacustris Z-7289]|uniref:Ferredoxin n=1 Tax=Methanosarcina lacustris Z-7289 TaxID=1434111 RepID=A0A0E3S4G5_9EURY|nr:4Fe-4S dicluster domain-containing protein [Methanosarcina lacustris]AKB73703.1 Ferredoxin [Methanosarcina lacustris Z-7289]
MAKADKKNKQIVQSEKCIGCGICYTVCPVNAKLMKNDDFDPETAELAIRIIDGMAIISDEVCIRCGACSRICPVESLTIVELESATA